MNGNTSLLNRLSEYDRLMKQIPTKTKVIPENCISCEYFQGSWQFRFCSYIKCRYGKDINVFMQNGSEGVNAIAR